VDNSPPYGDNYPLPPVSPLIYDKMTEIGGTIPYVKQKKFLGKMTPLLEIIPLLNKKNFWEKMGIYI
jgi:hypothetical protein